MPIKFADLPPPPPKSYAKPKKVKPKVLGKWKRRPTYDPKAPKVWCPEKARTIRSYPKTPEAYEEMRRWSSEHAKRMHTEGKFKRDHRKNPNGTAGMAAEVAAYRAEKRATAERIVAYMVKKALMTDDEFAITAMNGVVEIALSVETEPTAIRLKAMETLLKYTKPGPKTTAEVTIRTAEDWLAGLAEESAAAE